MEGLEAIVDNILKSAEEEASKIKAEADDYCKSYLEENDKEIQKEIAKIEEESKRKQKTFSEKIVSNGEFRMRNDILKMKGDMIDEVIDKAKETLKLQSDDKYFDTIFSILNKNVQKKDGEIKLSKKDLERLPSDFDARLKEVADREGINLTLSQEPADIDDGFILVYGDIEENATFDAIFESNKDDLRDIANKKLFE